MSSKDTLIHELSTSGTSAEAAVFLKKSQLTILDQNTSYHGSQSRINTSAISLIWIRKMDIFPFLFV